MLSFAKLANASALLRPPITLESVVAPDDRKDLDSSDEKSQKPF
jgi:hypothetical protein